MFRLKTDNSATFILTCMTSKFDVDLSSSANLNVKQALHYSSNTFILQSVHAKLEKALYLKKN